MIQGALLSFTLMLFAPEFHTTLLKLAASVRASADAKQAEVEIKQQAEVKAVPAVSSTTHPAE